jgi:gamma-glutamylcyclotransferase (GGCT)/AIG2-like uncharacterized protein YtfP
MMQRLFVYGTLQPGRANAHVLEAIGGDWQAASVVGLLSADGWGATHGYPALILAEHGAPVPGYVFSSERLADHWDELDAFEGNDYRRVVATARLAEQDTVEAYVYVLNAAP